MGINGRDAGYGGRAMSSLRKSAQTAANLTKSALFAACSRAFWSLKRAFSTRKVETAYRGGLEALGVIFVVADLGLLIAVTLLAVEMADPLMLALA